MYLGVLSLSQVISLPLFDSFTLLNVFIFFILAHVLKHRKRRILILEGEDGTKEGKDF
jgi:hypothetical protein